MWHIEVAFLLNHPILTQNGWAAQESTSRHCVSENWRFALRSTSYSDVFDWRAEPFSLNGILFLLCLCFQFYLSVKEKKILMRILSMGDKISKLMSGLFFRYELNHEARGIQIDIVSGGKMQQSFVCVTLSKWGIAFKRRDRHGSIFLLQIQHEQISFQYHSLRFWVLFRRMLRKR